MKHNNFDLFSMNFSLIEFIARIICFIVFPLYIINFGLDYHAAILAEEENSAFYDNIVNNLEDIGFYADNGQFVHHLLKLHYNTAIKSPDPAKSFFSSVSAIKNAYPEALTFVIADGNGNIFNEYSDETSYRFLFRQSISLIQEAKQIISSGSVSLTAGISDFEQRLRRLQNVLGMFVDETRLIKPLLPDRTASAVLASPSRQKYGLWYDVGDKLSVICFVSRDFMQGNAGAQWIIDQLNAAQSKVKYGLSVYPFRQNSYYPVLNEANLAETTRALGLFEMSYPEQFIAVNRHSFVCRLIDQKKRAFAMVHNSDILSAAGVKLRLIQNYLRYALLLAMILVGAYVTGRLRVGIELKLAGLFLYSVLIPGLVVAVFALRDVNEREKSLVIEAQANGLRLLERIDAEFPLYIADMEKKLTEFLASRSAVTKDQFVEEDYLEATREHLLARFNVDAILLVDAAGKSYVPDSKNRTIRSSALLYQVGRDISGLYGSDNLFEDIANAQPLSLQYAEGYLYGQNRIRYLGMGEADFYSYSTMFQFENDRSKNTAAIIIWEMDNLQKMFIEHYSKHYSKYLETEYLAAYSPSIDKIIFPESGSAELDIINYFRVLRHKHYVFSDNLSGWHSHGSIGCFMRGINMSRFYLAILSPRQNIIDEFKFFRIKTLLLLLTIFLVVILAFSQLRWAIMTPVGELRSVLKAVKRRDFRFRLDLSVENELGAVAQAFNRSLETLQELELASTVQETLLPSSGISHGKLSVNCFTQSMTSLEGDFYETIKVDSSSLFVFIGDSTGHGVPASLNMAMAKAVAVDSCERGFNVVSFLARLNHVFCHMRKSGAKDYMTGQCALFNVFDGSFSLYNAGHCFPLIVKATGSEAFFIKSGGLPLGFREPLLATPMQCKLEAGDTLIFYTDGLVEAVNDQDTAFGFDRFRELAAKSWHQNAEKFLNSILEGASNWSSVQQDDITLILCRFDDA